MVEIGRRDVIVVGVDGSAQSKAALCWAAEQATRTGSCLWAVTAWHHSALPGWGPTPPDDDVAAAAGEMLSQAVREALGTDPPVEVRETVIAGHPAQVLLDTARDAPLLVVGSHGRGGVAGALLGSVSQYCVQHAHCPVVVVRPTGPDGDR
jgi:nucleotide-binding universal stress UspA family protein